MVGVIHTVLLKLWRRLRKIVARMGSAFPDDEVYLLNRSPRESAR
jgi:hypothetical protein